MLMLLTAATLAGCSGEVGDVDHSCPVNSYQEQGSGCEHHQLP
jgi:hypothetical protein